MCLGARIFFKVNMSRLHNKYKYTLSGQKLSSDLSRVRDDIDKIDEEILSLLVKRMNIVNEVCIAKRHEAEKICPSGYHNNIYRPVRELQIIEKLFRKVPDNTNLSKGVIFNVWRAIINGTLMVEAPFCISVYYPYAHCNNDDCAGLLSMINSVREYFGFQHLRIFKDINKFIHSLYPSEDYALTIGFIGDRDFDMWGESMKDAVSAKNQVTLCINARLPFMEMNTDINRATGYIVSGTLSERHSAERSVLFVSGEFVEIGSIYMDARDFMRSVNMKVLREHVVENEPNCDGKKYYWLVEYDGHISEIDQDALLKHKLSCTSLGIYPLFHSE